MKSILISIKPEWVAKILNREKIVEIRKTIPKCDLPINVYIYCTKGKPRIVDLRDDAFYLGCSPRLNGKVVAKFTLNKISDSDKTNCCVGSCLTYDEIMRYTKGKKFYAWHIDNLEIFDKPKELSEFCYYSIVKNNLYIHGEFPLKTYLTKAPQSWCYVEVLK